MGFIWNGAAQLECDDARCERLLVVSCPDSRIVVADPMIYAQRTATRRGARCAARQCRAEKRCGDVRIPTRVHSVLFAEPICPLQALHRSVAAQDGSVNACAIPRLRAHVLDAAVASPPQPCASTSRRTRGR